MKIQKEKFTDLKEIADVIGINLNENSDYFEFDEETKEGKILKELAEYKQEIISESVVVEEGEEIDEEIDDDDILDYDDDDGIEDFYDDKHLVGLLKSKNFLKLENQLQNVIDTKIRKKINERKVQYLKKLRGE